MSTDLAISITILIWIGVALCYYASWRIRRKREEDRRKLAQRMIEFDRRQR